MGFCSPKFSRPTGVALSSSTSSSSSKQQQLRMPARSLLPRTGRRPPRRSTPLAPSSCACARGPHAQRQCLQLLRAAPRQPAKPSCLRRSHRRVTCMTGPRGATVSRDAARPTPLPLCRLRCRPAPTPTTSAHAQQVRWSAPRCAVGPPSDVRRAVWRCARLRRGAMLRRCQRRELRGAVGTAVRGDGCRAAVFSVSLFKHLYKH